jgi:hypothetical protein
VTKTNLDIFGGSVVPNEFVNQDGDPYIWALYRRFGASHFAHEVTLSNGIGGMQLLEDALHVEPRYERKHIDWQGDVLQRGVARISEWLSAQKDSKNSLHNISKFVLDIIVPSYRVKKSFLLPIIELVAPDNCDLMGSGVLFFALFDLHRRYNLRIYPLFCRINGIGNYHSSTVHG